MKGFEVLERENDAYTDSVGGSGTGHRRMKSIRQLIPAGGLVCVFVVVVVVVVLFCFFKLENFNPQCKFGSLNE